MKSWVKFCLLLICCALLVACQPSERVITATPAPSDTPLPPTITPTATATINPNNPHEGMTHLSELIQGANMAGPVEEASFGGRNFAYPRGFDPICEPFQSYPCAFVFNREGGYMVEADFVAGRFGFSFNPSIGLYPSDNYNYLFRCDISSNLRRNDVYPVAMIISDTGQVLELKGQYSANGSHVWVVDVDQVRFVEFRCLTHVQWAITVAEFFISYMGVQVVRADYGNPSEFIRLE